MRASAEAICTGSATALRFEVRRQPTRSLSMVSISEARVGSARAAEAMRPRCADLG